MFQKTEEIPIGQSKLTVIKVDFSRVQNHKSFFVLNSAEHEISPAKKVNMPTVGIFTFMSQENSILGISEPEKC